MGEVYRARDYKLKREVALKVLPDVFARHPERMTRFQPEADVLAALNHPEVQCEDLREESRTGLARGALSADIGSVIWRLASARAPERQIKSARVSDAGMLKAAPRRIACGVTVCFASRRKTNFQVG